jgi:hypothetical protein
MSDQYPDSGTSGRPSAPQGLNRPRRLYVVDRRLLPKAPPKLEGRQTDRRRQCEADARPNYWRGIDWRDELRDRPDALIPGDQGSSDACSGFAVAHALRANAAIHRGVLVDPNPYLIWGLAREADPRWRYGKAGLLHAAMLVVNNYSIPDTCDSNPGSRVDLARARRAGLTADIENLVLDYRSPEIQEQGSRERKIQGVVDLGVFLGDVSAWLHGFGPVVAHMMIDRRHFDGLSGPRERSIVAFDDSDAYEGQLSTTLAGHDVAIVGYVPNEERYGETRDSFVIMNSYGRGWGDGGFAYVPLPVAKSSFRACFGLLLREHLGYQFGGIPGPQIRSRLAGG